MFTNTRYFTIFLAMIRIDLVIESLVEPHEVVQSLLFSLWDWNRIVLSLYQKPRSWNAWACLKNINLPVLWCFICNVLFIPLKTDYCTVWKVPGSQRVLGTNRHSRVIVLLPVKFLFLFFSVWFGFFTIAKSDRSDRNKMQFFKNNYNLEFRCKSYLIFPVLAGLWVLCQIININNSKEWKST